MKNKKDYSLLTIDQLHLELYDLSKKKYETRVKQAVGQLKETHLIKKNRREIARVNTILSKKLYEQANKQ